MNSTQQSRALDGETHVSHFFTIGWEKTVKAMNDLLAAIYLLCFAAIAGGAFALMTQTLRSSARRTPSQSLPGRGRVHPEAPQPGEQVLYVDFSRERLEKMYQQTP